MNKLVLLLTLTLLIIIAGCSETQDTVVGPNITDQPPTETIDIELQKKGDDNGPDQEGDPWDDRKYHGRPPWNPPHPNPLDTL